LIQNKLRLLLQSIVFFLSLYLFVNRQNMLWGFLVAASLDVCRPNL
jgi:hypothetical protein